MPTADSPTADGSSGAANRPLPQLEFSTPKLDLGEGKPNEILQGELTLTNRGDTPAKFSLIKHCGCTELSPLAGELAPGASKTIHVGLQLAGHANSEKNTSIEVKAIALADLEGAGMGASERGEAWPIVARCVVTASCPSPLTVSPGFVAFGNLTTEEISRAEQAITVRDRHNRPLADPTAIEFECGSEHVLVDRDPNSADEVRLRVRLASTLPRGDTNAMVSIRPTGCDVASEMPIQVSHLEPIGVAPRVIIPGTGRAEEGHEVHTLFVWGNGSNTDLGRLLSIEAPEGILVTEMGDAGSRRRRLKVALVRASDAFPGGQIRLAFEHLKEALIVKVAPSSAASSSGVSRLVRC